MPIDALPFLDRTAPTFRADVDKFFLTDLPNWSTQLAETETNINERDVTTRQAALAAGEAAGMSADSAAAANASRTAAAGHAASALVAAQAAQASAGLPIPAVGVLHASEDGHISWRPVSKADVGLELADNTPDAQKPVSEPQAAALLPKSGGLATALGYSYKDNGTVAAAGSIAIDVTQAAIQRVQAAGTLTLTITGWAEDGRSEDLELHCVNFGGKTVTWPAGSWITSTGAYVAAVGNSGVTWQTSGTDRVLVMRDAGALVYKVMR